MKINHGWNKLENEQSKAKDSNEIESRCLGAVICWKEWQVNE